MEENKKMKNLLKRGKFCFYVIVDLFNSLIVWNNPFGVDVPLTEKPGLHKQKLETVPEENQ